MIDRPNIVLVELLLDITKPNLTSSHVVYTAYVINTQR
jgi:hypothetical protein